MPEWTQLIAGPLGALVGAVVAIGALVKGIVVPGIIYGDVKEQRDKLQAALDKALDSVDQLTNTNAELAREVAALKARLGSGG